MTSNVWLGLGGNVGDVTAAMAAALQNLDTKDEIAIEAVSPIYKTPPWGVVDQPWFFNCCIRLTTSLSPKALMTACQEQERIGKRERAQRWGPRTIDIDILIFQGVEQDDPELTLPHPRMLERSFVLIPLTDIDADMIVSGRSLSDWATDHNQADLEQLSADQNWWRGPGVS